MRTVSIIPSLGRTVSFLILIACDTLDTDTFGPKYIVDFSKAEYYVLPRSSTVIDFSYLVERAFTTTSITVSVPPEKGTLRLLDDFLWEYTPNTDFTGGTDKFVIAATILNGVSETINIYMKSRTDDFPCGVFAIGDKVAKINSVTAIHPLRNDKLCGVNGPVNLSIHMEPKYGRADVVGDSILYVPDDRFSGIDQIVYRLSDDNGTNLAYGVISIGDFETFELSGFNTLYFVNDLVGFAAGGYIIKKTVDGGEHWEPVIYPVSSEEDYPNIKEIFFLDENNGFIALTKNEWWGEDAFSDGGWMMTTNGGASWKRKDLDRMVKSIFFTSPSTGFISTSKIDQVNHNIRTQAILKTVDGGESWEEVFTNSESQGDLIIRFVNDHDGYAFGLDRILSTNDGGESWTTHVTNKFIVSADATDDNIVCTSLVSKFYDTFYESEPGTIARSENASTWVPMIYYPYTILDLAFSPSGELGIAAGVSSLNGMEYQMTISSSLDQGQTWNDVVSLNGFPVTIAIPSPNVAYILCTDKIITYRR